MTSQRTMRPLIAYASEQLDLRCSQQTYHCLTSLIAGRTRFGLNENHRPWMTLKIGARYCG